MGRGSIIPTYLYGNLIAGLAADWTLLPYNIGEGMFQGALLVSGSGSKME